MMILVGKWIAQMMDYVLGWMLLLPRDVAVIIVALGTSLILTAARRLTTNQDLMRRCHQDLKRLKQLKKQAKRSKHKPAVKRIQATVAMINVTRMKAEGWGLLASLIPIILLACWAFERLDYVPPRVGDELLVRATFPITSQNHPAWLLAGPADAVKTETSPVQIIRRDDNIDPITGRKIETAADNGLADWRLKITAPSDSIVLRIKYQGLSIEHPLKAGGHTYEAPILLHDTGGPPPWPDCSSQVLMKQAWFLERVPGMAAFWKWWLHTVPFMAPWLLAYLVITIPFVPLLRKVTRVY